MSKSYETHIGGRRTVGRAAVAFVGFMASVVASGAVSSFAGLQPPAYPDGALPPAVALAISSAIVTLGLLPLARRLGGPRWARSLALAVFIFSAYSVNTAIEALIFTLVGGFGYLIAIGVLPALVLGGLLSNVGGSSATNFGTLVSRRAPVQWALRLLLVFLAFPVIYFLFGMMVAPFVTPAYEQGGFLTLPPLGTIALTQLVRSLIFLVSALPILLLAPDSRRPMIVSLGLAYASLVGLAGLWSGGGAFPLELRILHSLEITADSFAYAAVVVLLLLVARSRAEAARATAGTPGLAP